MIYAAKVLSLGWALVPQVHFPWQNQLHAIQFQWLSKWNGDAF